MDNFIFVYISFITGKNRSYPCGDSCFTLPYKQKSSDSFVETVVRVCWVVTGVLFFDNNPIIRTFAQKDRITGELMQFISTAKDHIQIPSVLDHRIVGRVEPLREGRTVFCPTMFVVNVITGQILIFSMYSLFTMYKLPCV